MEVNLVWDFEPSGKLKIDMNSLQIRDTTRPEDLGSHRYFSRHQHIVQDFSANMLFDIIGRGTFKELFANQKMCIWGARVLNLIKLDLGSSPDHRFYLEHCYLV